MKAEIFHFNSSDLLLLLGLFQQWPFSDGILRNQNSRCLAPFASDFYIEIALMQYLVKRGSLNLFEMNAQPCVPFVCDILRREVALSQDYII